MTEFKMDDSKDEFIKEVFEIAFGCDAYYDEECKPRAFTYEEVLEELRQFSDDALRYTDPVMFAGKHITFTEMEAQELYDSVENVANEIEQDWLDEGIADPTDEQKALVSAIHKLRDVL